MKFKIVTYGCQMNEYESARMEELLKSIGFEEAEHLEDSDFVIFNSCAVREKSEEKLISAVGLVRSYFRKHGHPFSIVTGCVATVSEKHIKRVGAESLKLLISGIDTVDAKLEKLRVFFGKSAPQTSQVQPMGARFVFAYIPVIYGCDSFCSYCIVPAARGRERSRPLSAIIEEARDLVEKGAKEIILLGQNINHYGKDIGVKNGFVALLEQLDRIRGIERLRFLTSHPADFDMETLERMISIEHLMPHFHLPVQSGNDRILSLMKRGYTVDYYRKLVEEIRKRFSNAAITTDIIVGFPSETREEYLDTERLVKEICFDKSFISAYSIRQGTAASFMADQVDEAEKKYRLNRLLGVQNAITAEINRSYIGKRVEIFVEASKNGRVFGRNPQDKLTIAKGEATIGEKVVVEITDADMNHLKGELVP